MQDQTTLDHNQLDSQPQERGQRIMPHEQRAKHPWTPPILQILLLDETELLGGPTNDGEVSS